MQVARFESRLVEVLSEGAFYTLIRYNDLGMEITEYVENTELEFQDEEEDVD